MWTIFDRELAPVNASVATFAPMVAKVAAAVACAACEPGPSHPRFL